MYIIREPRNCRTICLIYVGYLAVTGNGIVNDPTQSEAITEEKFLKSSINSFVA